MVLGLKYFKNCKFFFSRKGKNEMTASDYAWGTIHIEKIMN